MTKRLITIVVMSMSILTTACVTTTPSTGQGPITLTDSVEEGYIAYLALPETVQGQRVESVFLVNQFTNVFNWYAAYGDRNPRDLALRRAAANCPGCQIFSINKNIVWEGFADTAKFEAVKASFTESRSTTLYDPAIHSISDQQVAQFAADLKSVENRPEKAWAFAISTDGKYAASAFGTSKAHQGFEVQRIAQIMCEATSPGSSCVVYAVNGKPVAQ